MPPAIHVVINGAPQEVVLGSTVNALLERLGLGKAACAVEVNKELVPKRDHGAKQLAEGDRIEIVTLVGGG